MGEGHSSSYYTGRRFEWVVKSFLEERRWFVVRHARSALPDLVATKQGCVLLVECKFGSGRMSRSERSRLVEYARIAGGLPMVATGRKGQVDISVVTKPLGLRPLNPDLLSSNEPADAIRMIDDAP